MWARALPSKPWPCTGASRRKNPFAARPRPEQARELVEEEVSILPLALPKGGGETLQ